MKGVIIILYQKMLFESEGYFMVCDDAHAYEIHRHPDMELSYCYNGNYDLIIDNQTFPLQKGDIAIINPMTAHQFLKTDDTPSDRVTIEVGPFLLGKNFSYFINMESDCAIIQSDDTSSEGFDELRRLLKKTVETYNKKPEFYSLIISGYLRIICSIILQTICNDQSKNSSSKKINIVNIDKSLNIIFNRYHEPLTIETVSAECGYSKSNFCKIFKYIVGDTFHNVLNRHRIDIACILLKNSNHSLDEIAHTVGFSDLKCFCRVFKKLMNENAGAYRKRNTGK